MTHSLDLPALDGRDPLGFLAALGLLRLLTEDAGEDVRLSFSDVTATAVLHGPYHSHEQVAATLTNIASREQDGVLPGCPGKYPVAKVGTAGPDPMRVPRDGYRKYLADLRQAIGDEYLRWQPAIATDLASDDKGNVVLTPFFAPSGQQTIRSFFEKNIKRVRAEPGRLREALTGWRRVDGVTGEYLDHRVLRNAADRVEGEPSEAGVPGATWLAIMALPILRMTGDGRFATATLWRRVGGRAVMVWPLWHRPLDLAAVVAVIDHPTLAVVDRGGGLAVDTEQLHPLGVFAIGAATRRQIEGRKSAGVLTPVKVDSPTAAFRRPVAPRGEAEP